MKRTGWLALQLVTLQLSSLQGQLTFPGVRSRFGAESLNPFLPILSTRPITGIQPRPPPFNRENTIGGILVNNAQVVGPPCGAKNRVLGDCRPLIRCVRFLFEINTLLSSPCQLPGGERGVCCPHTLVVYTPPRDTNLLVGPNPPPVIIPNIRQSDIDAATRVAANNIAKRDKVDIALFNKGVFAKRGTAVFAAQRFKSTNRFSSEDAKKALLALETSKQLAARFQLDKNQGTFALPNFDAKESKIASICPVAPVDCPDTGFRTIEGDCNNLENTRWGMRNIPLQRLLAPVYEDGIQNPRITDLPSAREVSSAIINDQDTPDSNYTLFLMQWGQFVDHDITHTPTVKGAREVGIICCDDNGGILPKRNSHRECLPISIPKNDRFYSKFSQTCMEFVRSSPAPTDACNFGPRQQVNQITAWLDGSNIYGSEKPEARKLRLMSSGRLRVTKVQGRELLPLNPNDCEDKRRHRYCFAAGDLRCNEQLDLAVTHTLWMREHNRIARELEAMNAQWDDERVYQEARRIVIGQLQHITFNEWLPIILGMKYMQQWKIEVKDSGYASTYDNKINPSITNVFSTAAFRFGHSMIQGEIQSFNLFGSPVKTIALTKTQFAPYDLYDNLTLETFVRGLTTQKSQKYDTSFSEQLIGHLFEEDNERFGMDLVSLNIQRGRDHALPPYMEWRKLCDLKTFKSWKSLASIFPSMAVARLQSMYKSVKDIDIFVGGLLEEKENDGILGPTFQCIIGDQFTRLKNGDRFWYENKANGFTEEQLQQIRQTSLSRVLCENTEEIGSIQPLAFMAPDVNNRRVACDSETIPRIDLSKWNE